MGNDHNVYVHVVVIMALTFIETTKFSSFHALAFDYEGIL